jgi:hypothetical protein
MGDKKSKTHLSTWNRRWEITIVVSSLATRILLLLQIAFQGATNHSLPPINKGRKTNFFWGFIWPIIPTQVYIGNHQTVCWTHFHTLSCNSNENTHLSKRPKNGLVYWLLINSQKCKVFGLDETTIPMCVCHICSNKLH